MNPGSEVLLLSRLAGRGRAGWRLAGRVFAAALVCCGSTACAAQPAEQKEAADDPGIGILHVRGTVYMLVGEQANATAQIGGQGVLLVDTMEAEAADELMAAIKSLTDEPVRHVINTHVHPDHVGSNAAIATAGDPLFNQGVSLSKESKQGAPIYAHENVLIAMSGAEEPPAFEGWPTSTYFTPSKDLHFNGEAVHLYHQPNAHTDGDSVVYFRGSDVISTGDVFELTRYPYIDLERGGSVKGLIAALNRIIEIAVPEALQEGGTLIIPGHGRLCDESEVVEYRDMLTIIRNAIQERIDEGMSLAEVQAARPTFGFDVRYGSDSGDWTTTQFVEAIYNELASTETQ